MTQTVPDISPLMPMHQDPLLVGLLWCRMFESSCQSQFDRRLCFSVVELPVVVKRSHKLNANIGASRLCETLRKGLISYLFIEVIKDTYPWASCKIRKIAGAHAPGMPGTFSPPPRVSDPDMHHGTCVTHVPWCMPGSLTSGFLWSRRWGKTFPAFPAHAQSTFCVSGKRPMTLPRRLDYLINFHCYGDLVIPKQKSGLFFTTIFTQFSSNAHPVLI